MPPIAIVGIRTARAASQTSFTAIGWIAGPVRPPVTLPRIGRRVSMSTAIAGMELISEIASAPHSSAARAKAAISLTFGASFGITGRRVAARTRSTTRRNMSRCTPKARLPSLMFGHETLIS